MPDGTMRPLSEAERRWDRALPETRVHLVSTDIYSAKATREGAATTVRVPSRSEGRINLPLKRSSWKTNRAGMSRLQLCESSRVRGRCSIGYVQIFETSLHSHDEHLDRHRRARTCADRQDLCRSNASQD